MLKECVSDELIEKIIKYCGLFLIFYFIFTSFSSFADSSISMGGTDNSNQMKDAQNLLTTMQSIGFNWVARLIGGFLVVAGIYKIASRDFMSGILATGGGGTLFFAQKIAESLAKMGGS